MAFAVTVILLVVNFFRPVLPGFPARGAELAAPWPMQPAQATVRSAAITVTLGFHALGIATGLMLDRLLPDAWWITFLVIAGGALVLVAIRRRRGHAEQAGTHLEV